MAVRQRGNSWQVDVKKDAGKWRVREDHVSRRDAEIAENEIIALYLKGVPTSRAKELRGERSRGAPKQGGMTLQKLLRLTHAEHWAGTRNENKCINLQKQLMDHFGADCDPGQITAQMIAEWQAHLRDERGLSPSTINKMVSPLSKALSYGVQLEHLKKKPYIRFIPQRAHKIRWFSDRERTFIVDWFEKNGLFFWRDFFIVALDTGARVSEIAALDMQDVQHEDRAWILPYNKKDLPRQMLLTARAYHAVTRHEVRHPFEFAQGSREINAVWDAMREELGLKDDPTFTPHACRHDCATQLLKKTNNLVLVQHWLGHKDIKTTLRYAHLVPTALEQGRTALEGGQVRAIK